MDDLLLEICAADDERFWSLDAGAARPLLDGAQYLVATRGEVPVGRLAFWYAYNVAGYSGTTGILGAYQAQDEETGVELLRRALWQMGHNGVGKALGPMDGSTWHRYRFALRGEEDVTEAPPFAGEPVNPPDYPAHWEAARFKPVAYYQSRAVALPVVRPGAERLAERFTRNGIQVRPADPERLPEELGRLHAFSARAFSRNRFYRPMSLEDFAQAQGDRPGIKPWLFLAEDSAGELLGFVFAYPDTLAPEEGRLIIKTLATAPEARKRGIGAYLADEVHRIAGEQGFKSAVHALMHESNVSMRLSGRYESTLLRRYVLFEGAPDWQC